MPKFIYVFDDNARSILMDMQLEILKDDKENSIYVFVSDGKETFSADGISYVVSDTLTF